ncbi:MAG: sirohydrochlorin cobaltochelatase [Methanotrichaceae archaeon]
MVISTIFSPYGEVNRSVREESAVLLVAFGTSYPEAQAAFDDVEALYKKELPNTEIRMAFTSDFIRQKIRKRDDVFVDNPITGLARLNDEGYVNVAVQSLHVIPGEEYHDLMNIVVGFRSIAGKFSFRSLALGMPLLTGIEDYRAVSAALGFQFHSITDAGRRAHESARDPGETAVVLMGHGTEHFANSAYSQMANLLEKDYENVFLGTVEGYPELEDVLERVKASGAGRVRLMPFMVVAGDHATNDMAGDEPDSWKSIFEQEGLEVEVYLRGMGSNEAVAQIFVAHTRAALGKPGAF